MAFFLLSGPDPGPDPSPTFLDKLIFAVFALVSMGAWGWVAYYPCQRLGA